MFWRYKGPCHSRAILTLWEGFFENKVLDKTYEETFWQCDLGLVHNCLVILRLALESGFGANLVCSCVGFLCPGIEVEDLFVLLLVYAFENNVWHVHVQCIHSSRKVFMCLDLVLSSVSSYCPSACSHDSITRLRYASVWAQDLCVCVRTRRGGLQSPQAE